MPSLYVVISCILSIQPEPHHTSTYMKGNFPCIIQPFLFYSAFQGQVGFTASTKLFQRQTADFVEYIFQQTSCLVFRALGPAWRQSSIRHTCWREESILGTNQTCRPTWAPHLLTSCVKYFCKQRSWTILWWTFLSVVISAFSWCLTQLPGCITVCVKGRNTSRKIGC